MIASILVAAFAFQVPHLAPARAHSVSVQMQIKPGQNIPFWERGDWKSKQATPP